MNFFVISGIVCLGRNYGLNSVGFEEDRGDLHAFFVWRVVGVSIPILLRVQWILFKQFILPFLATHTPYCCLSTEVASCVQCFFYYLQRVQNINFM